MEGPVCLIENTSAGDLLVSEEALVILSSIRQPVVVVSIVGMYRTGKFLGGLHYPLCDKGDLDVGDQKNETWLFALAILLSSTLIYNSMGTINNEALMSLHQNITISNAARNCIKKYFPCRKCFVFDPPTSKENLKTIEQMSDDELAPAFVGQTLEFCDYISHNARVKIVKGEAADGALQKFMDGKADLENTIRKADEELTEQENRAREEKLKYEQQMLEIHKANEQHLRDTVGVIIL
ncbi:hypothetical protein JZ751_016402 [Albula glossodonta]|uniref:Guanylate-binding protein N-terminal domain-containing protein n=1 Tax=Albula glossodonta TaxID=121402 RepID=A0A8T2NT99_9TELE|nr:hypothetical protein JZ751_016402 [Albula glossodonta]